MPTRAFDAKSLATPFGAVELLECRKAVEWKLHEHNGG
jgi:hypothetical protein